MPAPDTLPCRRGTTRPKTAPTSSSRPSSSSSSSIKGHLRCIFSRAAPQSRPTTPVHGSGSRAAPGQTTTHSHHTEYSKVQRAKRKKSTHQGISEEQRVMRILHNLQVVERTKTTDLLRSELTQLYIKPLPQYIQEKLKQHEDRRMTRSAILLEELFPNEALDTGEENTSADKIKLPDQKPLLPSRWQQKMLTKLEKMESSNHSSSGNSTPRHAPTAPTLNRQLQVQGQSSSSSTKAPLRAKPPPSSHTTPSPYQPPHPPPARPVKQPAFSYSDPLPFPTSYLVTKENTSPFEDRILELEKLERDSIIIERASSKMKNSNTKDNTTRVPVNMTNQPKYLDSTLAFQSRVQAQRKSAVPNSVTKGANGGTRSLTPTTSRTSDSFSRRRNMNLREKETILQQKRKNSTAGKLTISAKS